jgi:hypothetical protein
VLSTYLQGITSQIKNKEANDSDELMVDDDVWFNLAFHFVTVGSNA